MVSDKMRLSVSNWLTILGMIGGLLAVSGTIAGQYVFATKSDVAVCERNQALTSQTVNYQASQIQRVETRIENVQTDIQTQTVNMARLLERFRVEPARAPEHKPLPPTPVQPAALDFP